MCTKTKFSSAWVLCASHIKHVLLQWLKNADLSFLLKIMLTNLKLSSPQFVYIYSFHAYGIVCLSWSSPELCVSPEHKTFSCKNPTCTVITLNNRKLPSDVRNRQDTDHHKTNHAQHLIAHISLRVAKKEVTNKFWWRFAHHHGRPCVYWLLLQ